MRLLAFALLLSVPAALAQDTQTFHDDTAGLNVILPASFVASQGIVMPQGAEDPETYHRVFVDEATGTVLSVMVSTKFNPLQRFMWRRGRGDDFADRFELARLDVPSLSISMPATVVYEATPALAANPAVAERQREDPRHALLAYGCDGARCFRLVAEASTDVEQAVLGAVLYGVRFEG